MASSSSEVKDILFIIYGRQYSYVINAVDKNGIRMSQFKLSFGIRMDPLPFLGNDVSKFDGGRCQYYAFTRHCQTGDYVNGLYVFDDLMRDSNQELKIRPAPSEVVVCQERALAIVGEIVFVVRCGFAKQPKSDRGANHTMTVDRFEVSKKFGGQEGDDEYVALNAKDISFMIEKNVTWLPDVFIYRVPLSLRVDS